MESNLQQQIAELGSEFAWVTRFHRVQNFVRFFDQEFAQRRVRLLAIPGTPVRTAQPSLQRDKFCKPLPGEYVAALQRDARRTSAPLARALPCSARRAFLHGR